jgi:hypothetical protein
VRLSKGKVTRQQSMGLFAFMVAYFAVAFSIMAWGASAHSPPLAWIGLSILVVGTILMRVLIANWRRAKTPD